MRMCGDLAGTQYCLNANTYIRPIIAVLPALSRFIHCIRRWRDTRAKFPHLANAAKYSCAWFIVLFGTLAAHVPLSEGAFEFASADVVRCVSYNVCLRLCIGRTDIALSVGQCCAVRLAVQLGVGLYDGFRSAQAQRTQTSAT